MPQNLESHFNKDTQVVWGEIGRNPEDLEKCLPPGVTKDMVIPFLKNGGRRHWCWHLKPEFIQDQALSKLYKEQMGSLLLCEGHPAKEERRYR